jgi:hypothetical protein
MSSGTQGDDTQDDSASKMWELLETTPADMNAKFPHLATIEVVAKPASQKWATSKYQQYFDLLNRISYAIHDVVDKSPSTIVRVCRSHLTSQPVHP